MDILQKPRKQKIQTKQNEIECQGVRKKIQLRDHKAINEYLMSQDFFL